MQKEWMIGCNLPWSEVDMQHEAKQMYERMFTMKFLPPGRGLWAMGTDLTSKRKLYAALNNCAFVSTSSMKESPSESFCFLMDASMLGVGVGFDTKGAGSVIVKPLHEPPYKDSINHVHSFAIPDSREGWVESIHILLTAYLGQGTLPDKNSFSSSYVHQNTGTIPQFDYSLIRPKGSPIRGFGGTSQGHDILMELHQSIIDILTRQAGQYISITTIVDIMNLIGKCVVAGNVRRTAEISFGEAESLEYIQLKDYSLPQNQYRSSFGWTSNNSIYAKLGMNYESNNICSNICLNGEPGFAWLDNMRSYGRIVDGVNNKDFRAEGGNPCLEQTLESFEMCCLVETFPTKHESLKDYLETLKYAIIYAKTVTLGSSHWHKTNNILERNRRIGTSMSGLAQFLAKYDMDTLKEWCMEGYDGVQQFDASISARFDIPKSIKTTCIKPSGTVSLLAGTTPGMHYPESRFYIRRVRISKTSEVVKALQKSGFNLEDTKDDGGRSVVVEFPVDVGEGVRTLDEVSMWEQLAFASFLQTYWADNQV